MADLLKPCTIDECKPPSKKAREVYEARDYPQYFYIYPKSGYVTATQDYRDFCDACFSRTSANWYALGVNT